MNTATTRMFAYFVTFAVIFRSEAMADKAGIEKGASERKSKKHHTFKGFMKVLTRGLIKQLAACLTVSKYI